MAAESNAEPLGSAAPTQKSKEDSGAVEGPPRRLYSAGLGGMGLAMIAASLTDAASWPTGRVLAGPVRTTRGRMTPDGFVLDAPSPADAERIRKAEEKRERRRAKSRREATQAPAGTTASETNSTSQASDA